QEQVSGEHRTADETALPRAPRPDVDLRKEGVEAPPRDLIVHEILAVALGPEHVPAGLGTVTDDLSLRHGLPPKLTTIDTSTCVLRQSGNPSKAVEEIPEAPAFTAVRGRCVPAGDSSLDQPAADGVADEAGDLVDPQLEHEATAVGLGGLHGDSQHLGDLLRRLALGHQLQNLTLARGERVAGGSALLAVRSDHDVGNG